VWGDPALYDSTVRILQAILEAGRCAFEFEVIPGITSAQALAARHKVPLNSIGGSLEITTGRRLVAGQVGGAASVVVMLDAEDGYRQVSDPDTQIYWGAYVGMPEEILIAGRLGDVADDIERTRKAAREANGWIMDTYLLRKPR
jgi:precorrin-6A synthase